MPGDVQGSWCGKTNPGTPVVEVTVAVAVPPELGSQYRHEPGIDVHRRPRARAAPFDLADDLLPRGGEREVVGALGGLVGRLGADDPVDPEGSLPSFGPADQVPDVVLVDQAPRVDQPLAPLFGAPV